MNENIAIKVQNLTKTYKLYKEPMDRLKESLNPFGKKYHREFHALKGVSFEVKKGETVGIVGRNGSGKSTLLKIIANVVAPTSGNVFINGKLSAILELGAGFNPEMNGVENIYLNTSINGMSKKETDEKLKDIIDFTELNEFIYQPLKTYSSGMKARLAFALAINVEPDILIVDEALAVGDAAFQRKCFAKMEQIREAGATILFVSHNESSIVNLCNRAIWINGGKLIVDGKPKFVTGLYMKNANKRTIDKATIEKELQKLEKSSEKKNESKESKKNIPKPTIQNSKFKIQNSKLNSSIEEFFDPSLKPKSTIYYEEKGAKISDVKITTLDGKEVNVLVYGRKYIYRYKVEFMENQENVRFGCAFKTKQGISIVGGSKLFSNYVKKNTSFNIKWIFLCLFNEGVYYLNAGVSANKVHIHRILDSCSFKVLPVKDKFFVGYVNLLSDCEIAND